MSDPVDIRPDSLHQAATGVRQAAAQLEQDWGSLQAGAQGMGDIFGDDMVGGLIGASYAAAQQIAQDSFGSALDGFGQIADGLDAMADLYAKTEDVNTHTIDRNRL